MGELALVTLPAPLRPQSTPAYPGPGPGASSVVHRITPQVDGAETLGNDAQQISVKHCARTREIAMARPALGGGGSQKGRPRKIRARPCRRAFKLQRQKQAQIWFVMP